MPRPPGMADPDKWTLDLPPGPDCSVGCSSNEFVSEDGSSLPGRENEDKFYTCNYQGKIQIYMVLDGHDGTRACEFAQKHLPSVLLSSELDGGVEMVGRAMRWAFLNTEREFFLGIDPHITRKITLQIEIQKARNSAEALSMFPDQVDEIQRLDNQIKGGTTAVLAIIYNGYLHIANVGDSRAILCYQGRDGHLHVEQLSVDHKTSNEDELRRLEDCGLNPNELRRHKRLGIQQNTRSIGDHSIKGGYKDIDVISHATREPGTAEPFIAMPVDLRNIFSGFLVLMSDGLYDAYQLYTQRPAFVNQDLGYLIAQEMKQSNDIAAVAQNVVEKVKQLYRSSCKKNVYKGRLDDITLVIRNLNYPMASLSHTASYPGSLSGVSYPPIHTAPILPNARQNVFFPNPPYQHETAHGYATNVPPEYRDHSRVPGYMYDPRPHPPVGGYLTQPHVVPRAISDPKLQPSNADVSIGGGPSVGIAPGYQIGHDGYQHPQQQPHWSIQPQQQQPPQQPLWSIQPQQQQPPQQPLWSIQPQQQQPQQQPQQDAMFTVGDPHGPQPKPHLTTQMSTTPSQSTVRPRTNTHSYVNVSPSSTSTTITAPTTVTAVGTFSNNGGLTPHESPAHSTPLQVPRKISHGYQNVSLSPTVHEQKRYSDSQLEEQMQALNLEATSNATRDRNAHTPPPMGNHPSHYSPVSRSVMKSPVPLPRRDLKPIQPKDSSDEFDLYGWKVDDVTPMSSQPSSLAANSEGRTLTGPPHEEETIDKPDSDSEHNEDGDNIGVLTLPGDPLLSDFSETSDLEEEEKDVDPDGMIKSHVKFNTKFDMNLPWDELGGKETPLQGFLQGVEVIGVTEVTVPTQGVSFEWEGYGLRLCVPKGSLPVGVGDARVSIKASLSGQFLLPEDSDLLSPVFWISTPCKFIKPVTLKIQHCALREDETVLSDLSFVSAECSFPYRFRQINGGVFTTDSSYGSIQLSNFSGKGITGKKKTPRLYCAYLYHTMKQLYDWRYYFVVSQDLDAKNRVVREHYGHFAREEATLRIRFSRSEITLDIPVDGRMTKDGWRITPRSYPTISRKDADQYEPGQWIPECQLIVQWTREDQKPVQLMHKVDLIGAKAPYNFIQLTLNPVIEEIVRYPSISSSGSMDCSQGWQSTYQAGLDSEPELPDLMNEVAAKIPSKWRDIGLQLGVDQGALKEIAAISPGDTNLCYTNVFTRWKNQNSMTHPYTWSTIVHALQTRAVGEERLAYEIRNNLTGHPSQ